MMSASIPGDPGISSVERENVSDKVEVPESLQENGTDVSAVRDKISDAALEQLISAEAVVLMIEDEDMLPKIMLRALRGRVKKLMAYANPRQALDAVYDKDKKQFNVLPHYVFCDTNLPVMNGNEFLALLSEAMDEAGIPAEQRPILLATSGMMHHRSNTTAMEYYAAHGIDVIEKPYHATDIGARIISDLKKHPAFCAKK
jgi:CheY-like chemotaxis protein